MTRLNVRMRFSQPRAAIAIAVWLAALLPSLFLATTAEATSFAYSNAFGATGITNTLDHPGYGAIDPANHYIYVANYDYPATNTIERFNYDGTPAPFATGDVNSNVLGVADMNDDKAVFRGTSPAPGSFNCATQAANVGSNYNPSGVRCFNQPSGIAVDENGNFYVANSGADTVDIFNQSGSWVGEIGPSFSNISQNGYELARSLDTPAGLAYDTTSNLLFIADASGHIWVFHNTTPNLPTFTYVGALGSTSGPAANQLFYPAGLATDNAGNLYIADSGNDRIDHWTYSLSGNSLVAAPQGNWTLPGSNAEPEGIAYTAGDVGQTPASIFVTDANADSVEQFSTTGSLVATVGSHGSSAGQFDDPFGIAALANDGTHGTNLFVVDQSENQIDRFIPSSPSTTTGPPTAPTPTPPVTTAPAPVSSPTVVAPSSSNTSISSAPKTATITTALSAKGQVIRVKTVSGATVTLVMSIAKKTAKAAHLGNGKRAVTVGTTTVKSVVGTTATLKAVLTGKARKALSKLHKSFKLTLRTTFNLAGHAYAVSRVETVNLSRPRGRNARRTNSSAAGRRSGSR